MGRSSATQAVASEEMARRGGGRRGGRERVLVAARELFAEHGVSGTSLQMIADRIGVTKAAVYHQFHTKREIELALLEPVEKHLRTLVDRSERVEDDERRQLLVQGLVDLFIAERQTFASLQRDPELGQVVAEDPDWAALVSRLQDLFLGPDPDLSTRVALTMLSAGLGGVVLEPEMSTVPDDELRAAMLVAAWQLLG